MGGVPVGVGDVVVGMVGIGALRPWVGHGGQSLGPEERRWDVVPVSRFSLVSIWRCFWGG